MAKHCLILTFVFIVLGLVNLIEGGQFNSSIPSSSITPLGDGRRGVTTYWLIREYESFYDADVICREAGYSLLSIESETEQLTVASYVESTGFGGRYMWSSGNDIAVEGDFVWKSTLRKMYYTNFYVDPNASAGGCAVSEEDEKDCVSVNGDNIMNYQWVTARCSTPYWFICEL